jgi:tetratricopeptide (TPR) repeat protein
MIRLLDWTIEAGLLGLLLFAPLPFGAVDAWASAVLVEGVAALVALCGARMLLAGEVRVTWTPLLWPALAGLALAALQLRPGGSLNPHATAESVRLYAAYAGLLVVLGAHLVTRARVVRLLWFQVAVGTALAAVGLASRASGRALAPWFPADFTISRLVSTFVNPNHQALYFEMAFFLALGLLLRPRRGAGSTAELEAAPRVATARLLRAGLALAALLVLGAAIALTFSRGGFLGLGAGLATVAMLGLWMRTGRATVLIVAPVFAAVLLLGAWLGFDRIAGQVSQLGRDPFADVRWIVWERTVAMIGAAPLAGSGLGTYVDAFPPHRPPGIESHLLIDHPHNDYLQLAAELGVPAVVLVGWALVALVAFVVPRWRARHDPFVRGVTLGGLGGVAAIAVHSVVDFGLHMPANAVLAVVVAALLPSVVALRTRRGSGGGVDLPAWSVAPSGPVRALGGLALATALVLAAHALVPSALADWHVQQAGRIAGGKARGAGAVSVRDLVTAARLLEEAARLDPGAPAILSAVAEVNEDLAARVWSYGVAPEGRRLGPGLDERVAASQEYFAAAYVAYGRSLELNPWAARVHDRFGRFLGSLEAVRQAVRGSSMVRTSLDPRLAAVLESEESLLPRARRHLEEGVRLDPLNPYRHRNLGVFALTHARDRGGAAAAEAFRRALAIDPVFLAEIVDRLEAAGVHHDVLQASIPQRLDVWVALGRHYERRGRHRAAASAYEEALGLVRDPAAEAGVRLALGRALLQAREVAPALAQVRRALVLAPRNPEAHTALAAVYEAMGDVTEAAGALQTAVSLADGDVTARNGYRDDLAQLYDRQGRYREAVLVRRQMVQDSPHAGNRWNLALVLHRAGNREEALEQLDLAARASTPTAHFHVTKARILGELERLPAAIQEYEAALRVDPGRVDARMELADLLARTGARVRAAEQYRTVLSRDPNHDGARRALAALGSGQ